MGETYTSLGPAISWTLGAMMVLVSVVMVIWRSIRAKKLTYPPHEIGITVVGLVLALWPGPLPLAWIFPGMFLGFAILALVVTHKDPKVTKMRRLIVGLGGSVMAVVMFFMFQNLFGGTFVLGADDVIWESYGRGGQVSREGLEVHATGSPKRWFDNRETWSWTSYSDSGTAPLERLGPSVIGFELYWGPDGMVTGDELGERLAEWAGTKPKYRMIKELDAEIKADKSRTSKGY